MKKDMKHLIMTITAVCLFVVAAAQDTVSGPDGKVKGWYMSYWYDTCYGYYDTAFIPTMSSYRWDTSTYHGRIALRSFAYGSDMLIAKGERVKHPAAVKGVGVWVMDHTCADSNSLFYSQLKDTNRLPEYIYIYQWGNSEEKDSMILLDSVRWDTAVYQHLKVPLNVDSTRFGFWHCLLYTAYFDHPVEVDSLFFMAGSRNSYQYDGVYHWCLPTWYMGAFCCTIQPRCPNNWSTPYMLYSRTIKSWSNETEDDPRFQPWGAFMPLIDFVDLHVVPADSSKGTAGPYDTVSMNTTQLIWAQPYQGYRFSHWDDGDTNNPRYIRLMCDTTFVAYFDTALKFHVEVSSNRDYGGRVEGGGDYYANETATLRAVPLMSNYRFVRWNDGNTSNPRYVVVTQDTAFEAQFAREDERIEQPTEATLFSLSPNPAQEEVTVTVDGVAGSGCWLTLNDEAGRELLRHWITDRTLTISIQGLAAGLYFVTIDTPQGSETQKLIIN